MRDPAHPPLAPATVPSVAPVRQSGNFTLFRHSNAGHSCKDLP